MQRPSNTAILIVAIGLIASLSFLRTYRVISRSDAYLLWNANEAFLFIDVGHLGYRLTYLEFPLEIVAGYFGVVRDIDGRAASTIVVRITPQEVKTSTAKDTADFYTPLEGSIFANHKGDLWKWSGTHFEQASVEEQRRYNGTSHLSALDFTSSDGWSRRYGILNRLEEQTSFPLELNGKSLTLVVSRQDHGREVTVNLLRPDRAAEEIWHLDQQPRKITEAEYRQLFQKP
jgi:hypothetical protein